VCSKYGLGQCAAVNSVKCRCSSTDNMTGKVCSDGAAAAAAAAAPSRVCAVFMLQPAQHGAMATVPDTCNADCSVPTVN
jgi:hypothetical protein